MTNIKVEAFKQSIKEGDLQTAKLALADILNEPISKQEKGAILVSASLAYMKLVNGVNSVYNDNLKELIQQIKLINTSEKEVTHHLKVEQVRASL